MATTLTIRDETTAGQATDALSLEFLTERITVRELIRSRVYQEVKDHNAKTGQTFFKGLVQPTDAESELNGYKLHRPRQLDWKRQYEVALESFERNGFLILINDKQAEGLDQNIEIETGTTVSFLKLVPLVGG